MSKVFEALQRLERESGKVLPGVLPAAQEVFKNGGDSQATAPVMEPEPEPEPEVRPIAVLTHTDSTRANGNGNGASAERAEPAFRISNIRGENVTLTPESRLVYHLEPDSPGADRFRLLRMRLWPLWEASKLKTLLVTSALAQDGKSTVVMNLATALAEQGQRSVLVVEGDLCHPSLSPRLGLSNRAGLSECLEGGQNPLSLIRRMDPLGWYLLSAGDAQGNPTELLQSPLLANIFETLRSYFDWIIIDTPPAMPLTDTLSLRQYADSGLLVVRADKTPKEAVEAVIARIGTQNLLGIVLSASEEIDRLYSDYRKSYGPGGKAKLKAKTQG
jgi:capsular exopolysaccharide synthesis family protein